MSQTPPNYDADYSALLDPNTSPDELQRIASTRFDLHAHVLAHPGVYPELVEWITQVSPQAAVTTQSPMAVPAQAAVAVPEPAVAVPLSADVSGGGMPAENPPKKRTGLVLGVIGVVVFALVIAAGAWWLFFKPTSSTSYATLPSQGAVVNVATFGEDVRLTPIGSGAISYEVDGIRLIGIQSGPTFGIAGVAANQEAMVPQWIVPVGNPSECVLNGTRLTCGDDWAYEVSGGNATPVEGGEATVKDEEDGSEDEAEVEEEEAEEPVVENPYGVGGVEITDSDGAVVFDFGSEAEQIYALAPSGRGNTWLFSDGRTVIAVKGSQVLWQVKLAEGSAGANGFGTDSGPTWTTSGNVLLIAEPSGVLALDIATGEEVWRIDTPVESWMATETALVISDGVNLTTYLFGGEDAEVDVAQSGADTPTQAPAADALMNATLEIPESCATLVGLPAGNASFTEGNADGTDGWMQITGLAQSLADGELLSVVAFSCHSGETAVQAIGAYSAEMELVAPLDYAAELSVAPDAVESIQIRGQGSAVQVLVATEGGTLCEQCSPDTAAQVTMMWDGAGFATSRVGDAPTWWDEVGNAEVVEAAGRGLAPEDLADITLVIPVMPGKDEGGWEEVSFHNYVSEPIPWGDAVYGGGETIYYILEDETVEATINGEPYLFVSLLVSSGPGSLGSVCAVSADKEVVCALHPPTGPGTDHAWAVGIQVTGDEVSYGIDPGFVAPGGVVQRFDGTSFTFVR